jgi:hypothetical protein
LFLENLAIFDVMVGVHSVEVKCCGVLDSSGEEGMVTLRERKRPSRPQRVECKEQEKRLTKMMYLLPDIKRVLV